MTLWHGFAWPGAAKPGWSGSASRTWPSPTTTSQTPGRRRGPNEDARPEVRRISGLLSFEPDKIEVRLDDTRLRLEPGQRVIPHGVDRDLTTGEAASGRQP